MTAPYDKAAQVEFLKGTERAPEHLLRDWTARLASGERGIKADGLARAVIRDFALRQWFGQPQSPATSRPQAPAPPRHVHTQSIPPPPSGRSARTQPNNQRASNTSGA